VNDEIRVEDCQRYYMSHRCKSVLDDPNQLRELYLKYSQTQLSERLGVSRATVQRKFKKFGLKARSYTAASSFMNEQRTIEFDGQQEQLVYGSLLGDACLHRSVMRSNKTGKAIEIYKLIFSHSEKQLDYLKHKRSILKGSKICTRESGFGSVIKHYAFCHTPTLRKVAELCHDKNHRKKVTKSWLSKIGWQGLAFWFMDDGYIIMSQNRPCIYFATHCFNKDEIKLLRDMLKTFGLTTSLRKSPNPNPNERIIVSKHKSEVNEFISQMRPFVIPLMSYKLKDL